ncbi:flagellar biosynthesis protein FlhF [Gilvimarinus polysaccharolyticus]|uniref:flagellar biosynthesis protein FlhF n=1 Tax=Gilvimarinus polysaccharolyticus TaxID=863921 RepID=UPI0006732D22|nr:flagellar biosynthesis protein FlhF [Gilvimarinus polysaccharolyticus]
MQVKRFVATDMRRALELVRQELGSDAIILSSRRVREGVEILTSAAQADAPQTTATSMSAASSPQEPTAPDSSVFAGVGGHKSALSAQEIHDEIAMANRQRIARQQAAASADEYLGSNQVINAGIARRETPEAVQPAATPTRIQTAAERYGLLDEAPHRAKTKTDDDEIGQLHEEIAQMRELLEEQLSRFAGAPPSGPNSGQVASLTRRFERMGFSAGVCESLLKQPFKSRVLAKAWPEAMARLAKAVPIIEQDLTAQGGVFALVGPTGAGKTTTIAKLAARYVLEHGADKVALVTTDTYRLAGHDQLRSLASILQVPVRVVDENNSLSSVLRSVRRCELVLIDTPGLRHGAPELKQQMAQLAEIAKIKSLLVLPANSQAQMLQASRHAYSAAGLSGCILTKLDETASLGEAVSCAIGSNLPIAYTTNGQEIPADISPARGHQLVAAAVQLAQQNQHGAQARG